MLSRLAAKPKKIKLRRVFYGTSQHTAYQKAQRRSRELSYGSFRRVIPLDAEVDADKVEASFHNGVLKVTLPKISNGEEK